MIDYKITEYIKRLGNIYYVKITNPSQTIEAYSDFFSLFSTYKKSTILCLTKSPLLLEHIKKKHRNIECFTWNDFCYIILKNHGYLIDLETMPFILEHTYDITKFLFSTIQEIPEIYEQYKQKTKNEQKYYLYQIQSYISEKKTSLNQTIKIESDEVLEIYKCYQKKLKESFFCDLFDLYSYVHQLFDKFPEIAQFYGRIYTHICIPDIQEISELFLYILHSMEERNKKSLTQTYWLLYQPPIWNEKTYFLENIENLFKKEIITILY